MKYSVGRACGFSLVEVALALGIVSFCLLSMLSLFAIGLESGRRAEQETFLSEIAVRIFNEEMIGSVSHYPDSGFITSEGIISPDDGAYAYEIGLESFADPGIGPVSENLSRLSIIFRWPVGAEPANQQTLLFQTAIPRKTTPPAAPEP